MHNQICPNPSHQHALPIRMLIHVVMLSESGTVWFKNMYLIADAREAVFDLQARVHCTAKPTRTTLMLLLPSTTRTNAQLCVCVCLCAQATIYICVYICVHVYVYMYITTYARAPIMQNTRVTKYRHTVKIRKKFDHPRRHGIDMLPARACEQTIYDVMCASILLCACMCVLNMCSGIFTRALMSQDHLKRAEDIPILCNDKSRLILALCTYIHTCAYTLPTRTFDSRLHSTCT